MNKLQIKMNRCEMQTEALIIESLLNAAIAIFGSNDPQDALIMVGMAHDHAEKLNTALDSTNAPAAML